MKNLKAGFSLVELMVVVAIIGILATIAVPNFTKFQAKAKQANAKSELSGLYTAEKAFFTEYNTYHSNLPYIGYVPDGLAINSTTNCPSSVNAGVIRYYAVGFGAGGILAPQSSVPISCGGNTVASMVTYYPASGTSSTVGALATGASTATTFTAFANGIVSNTTRRDIWTMTEGKSLINTQQGI